ncbi:hypothetical protein EN829_006960 [Mesorhizobium sp. M00.F.Ca.ET.186.01.1.1]|nr:hypothetical protein EN829_006960 [Mesorhizobium sp. M00.F.Ca.ET.186.01.1.1]
MTSNPRWHVWHFCPASARRSHRRASHRRDDGGKDEHRNVAPDKRVEINGSKIAIEHADGIKENMKECCRRQSPPPPPAEVT